MPTNEGPQQLTRQASALRSFYSALWVVLDSKYPGYFSSLGGPPKEGELSGLPKARGLLEGLTREPGIHPEFQAMLESDYARTEALLAEYETLSDNQKPTWLQEHQEDRKHLLERTEQFSLVLATPPDDAADIIRQVREERVDQIIGP